MTAQTSSAEPPTSTDRPDVEQKESVMCLTCDHGNPNDDHGNPATITAYDIDAAARAGRMRPADVARRIYDRTRALEQQMSLIERFAQR
jgi:hypothetical protein